MNSLMNTPPPAPNPDAGSQPQQQQSPQQQQPMPPSGNALQMSMAPGVAQGPSHAQTVAMLRHMHAVQVMYAGLYKNPDLGRRDLKSEVIDATTKLVAERMVTPAQAVMQLATVPENPLEQRKWVQGHLADTVKAQVKVLSEHRLANPGSGDFAIEQQYHPEYDREKHMDTVSGGHAHYRGRAK